jgi:peptide chain release factor subunit 1
MLNREELKELAKIRAGDSLFVSLYLNVNPVTNAKNDYMIHLKNILKQAADTLGKQKMKEIAADVGKIESYCKNNKRMFKRGLAIMSASTQDFWKEFHLSVPLKNEVIVDTSPYIKPLLDILDNYQRYAILLVGRDSARLFLVHLGEIEEYAEVRSEGVPRRHKKGGWYALSEKSYERHIDYHVSLHLKDVVKALDSFLSQEYVGRVILGGSDEAVPKVREMLPHAVAEKIIGTFQADMQAKDSEILETSEPILAAFEKKKGGGDSERASHKGDEERECRNRNRGCITRPSGRPCHEARVSQGLPEVRACMYTVWTPHCTADERLSLLQGENEKGSLSRRPHCAEGC